MSATLFSHLKVSKALSASSSVVLYRIHTLCCIFSPSKSVPFVPAILEQSFRPPHLFHCIFRQRWKMADLTGNYEGPSPWWGLGLSERREVGGGGALRLDKMCWCGCRRLDIMDPNTVCKIIPFIFQMKNKMYLPLLNLDILLLWFLFSKCNRKVGHFGKYTVVLICKMSSMHHYFLVWTSSSLSLPCL